MRRVRAFPLQSCVMRVLFAIVAFTLGTTVRADGFSDVLSYLDRCRSDDFDECLERDLTQTIDGIMNKTGTYRINRYLVVTVRASDHPPGCNGSSSRNVGRSGDSGAPILNFFNALRVRYQPEMIDQPTEDVFEGRKKKKGGKKHKMGMMMGIASLFMSLFGGMAIKIKLILVKVIALKALIIAKIALALASIIALKKLGGGGGGTVVQPVWAGSSGGGSDHGGYRRSYEHEHEEQKRMSAANALAYKAQLDSYDMHSNADEQSPL